jgi:hypothetical protein
MPPSRRWTDDAGSASLEFVTAGLVLLVPLVYLVLTMSAIQAGALAVEGAARQAARVFVQSDSVGAAQAAALRAVDFALADHGIPPGSAEVAVSCTPRPSACLTRQGFVTVAITLTVPLPLAPPVLGDGFPLAVPLQGSATQQVSRFWGSG